MKKMLWILVLTTFSTRLCAQVKKVILINSRKIDLKRYDHIKGDPYLFKDWQYGKVTNSAFVTIDSVLINYNGYTNSFEVRQDDEYIELEPQSYPLIVLYSNDNEIFFKRNNFKKLRDTYSRLIYSGKDITAFENFKITVRVSKSVLSGMAGEERFISTKSYFINFNDELFDIKLQKKSVLNILGHHEEIQKFIKKENIKMNTEKDLCKILEFYELTMNSN